MICTDVRKSRMLPTSFMSEHMYVFAAFHFGVISGTRRATMGFAFCNRPIIACSKYDFGLMDHFTVDSIGTILL